MSKLHYAAIFWLTFGDSFFSCLQVRNLVNRQRVRTFLCSIALSSCKITAIVMTVQVADFWGCAAYVCAGTLGAQYSLVFAPKHSTPAHR